MLLHPIYVHAHGDAHSAPCHQDVVSESSAPALDNVGASPALRSAAPENGGYSSTGGMALPLQLAGMLLTGRRLLDHEEWLSNLHDPAPPTQPPRLADLSQHVC
jgi:hypothetical protein